MTGDQLPPVTEVWRTRSVLPGGRDGGAIVYTYRGGTRQSQLDAERVALKRRGL